MWIANTDQLDDQTLRVTLKHAGRVLSFGMVVDLWTNEESFRKWFNALLADSPFQSFFWEAPPVKTASENRAFEFVMIQSASLSRTTPDGNAFTAYFEANPSLNVVSFPNLGGDALLIVPAPIADPACYTHLARFVRNAPGPQQNDFWRAAGIAMTARISERPVWLSTAGLGVPWLHLRLDSRAKYYRHKVYAQMS